MAFAETQHLVVQLDLKGNLNQKLGDAARSIKGFDKATSNTQQSLSKFGRNIERGIVLGAVAAAGAIGTVVKAASDYESAFAGVRKTVTATEPELQALSSQFRELSKQIPISASALARLGEAGGALGVPTKDLKEFVRVTALLGVTTNLTADEAANSLGVLGNVLHLTGVEYSKFASSLVALGNAGASTEADIVAIAERAGAAGALIGTSTEEILGFSSAIASLGIEAEAGGTALQKFFIDSAKAVAGGGKDLREFAKVAGVSAKSFQKAFKDDAGAALEDFLAGLGKLPQAKQLQVLEDLGFTDARITRTLLGLANNTKLVGDQMDIANKAFAENTALTKEADQRFNTFDSQLQITKNTLTDMAITIGSKLLPKITPLLKRLNEFVGSHTADIERFGDNLASGFEKLAEGLGKVNWQPFIDGLKLSADIAKDVIGIFRSLPEGLQAALIGGFALNKVTGGLGTSLAKDIGGAVLGNFASRGSSPANPMWVTQVGGIPGVGGGESPGGLLGVIKSAAKWIVPLAVGIATVEVLQELNKDPEGVARPAPPATFGRFGATKPGGFGTGASNSLEDRDLKDLNRTMTGVEYHTGKMADDIAAIPGTLRASRESFHSDLWTLIHATKALDVQKAAKKIGDTIGKGIGNAANTEKSLGALKTQLTKTDDPKTRAVLKAQIARVEHVLPDRQFAAKQYAAVAGILKDGKITAYESKKLKAIMASVKDRGLPAVSKRIAEKVEAARKTQQSGDRAVKAAVAAVKAATDRSTQATKDQDLSVTLNNTVNTTVSIRDTIKRTTVSSNFGHLVPS